MLSGMIMSGNDPVAAIEQGRVVPVDPARMPLYLAAGGELDRWLESRAIDRHRPNSRILKKLLRLTDTGDRAAVLCAHAATITDDYWLRGEDEPDLRYEEVRYTENLFAEVALTGSFDSYNEPHPQNRTPELTNIGSFEKCWKIEDGAWYLYKQGNALERFSELFIARLGGALGFDMAVYEAVGAYLRTRDFTGGKCNYEPAAAVVGDNEDSAFNYGRIEALRPGMGKQYLDILYLDALCFNMDRHTYNYGFLRDRSAGEIMRMAPNFDNNIALISRGYGPSPLHTNGLLIDLFHELLERAGLSYSPPPFDAPLVQRIAEETLPGEDIDRDYVGQLIMDRGQRLRDGMREQQTQNEARPRL